MAQINNLEKEVDSLKKELASQENTRDRETRNDSSSNEVAALKARCTSLQQDNERLSKLLREREREKERYWADCLPRKV
jgi:cell shape-determining protein MreC